MTNSGLTVLVDDTRHFRDDRACLVARSSAAAITLLSTLRGARIDHLWLDHDLGGNDDVWPVIRLFEEASLEGRPFEVGLVHVQASRSGPAHRLEVSMRRLGYRTERPFDLRLWTSSGSRDL